MDSKKLLLGAAIVGLSAAVVPGKAKAATTNVNISARIYQAINVTATDTLNFGILNQGATAGTATVGVADSITATSGTVVAAGGTVTSGGVKVYGQNGAAVVVAAQTAPAVITDTIGGVATMSVDSFNVGTAAGGNTYTTTIAVGTTIAVPIGGTLNVGASQTQGNYKGTFSVSALYQ